jgi:alpha-L-fucosidase
MAVQDWFDEARFGLFVHWGHYARSGWEASWPMVGGSVVLPEGQSMNVEIYHANARGWVPDMGAPERWVAAAAAAGMRYAVLTTRHHDGYSLWPSKFGEHGVSATAPGVDIVRAFVDACRKHGLKIGFYYSLSDWFHPDYPAYTDDMRPYILGKYAAATDAQWAAYQVYLRGQLTELLTEYGKIDLLWFDGGWERTAEQWDTPGLETMIRGLQPDIMINDRLPHCGDYITPEQFVPAEPPGCPWETCMTMNHSWGWNPADTHYKPVNSLIHTLCEVTGRGGNLLLNISPDGDGNISAPQLERLQAFGRWMAENGDSVRGTKPGLKPWQFYGPTSRRGKDVFCYLLMQPVAPVSVRGVKVRHVKRVVVQATGEELTFETRIPVLNEMLDIDGEGELLINVNSCDPVATVLRLEFDTEENA